MLKSKHEKANKSVDLPTKICRNGVCIKFASYKCRGVENDLQDSSSKDLGLVRFGFFVQYRGKPSKAVGSCLAQHTLKNLPFQPL